MNETTAAQVGIPMTDPIKLNLLRELIDMKRANVQTLLNEIKNHEKRLAEMTKQTLFER